MQSRGSGEDVFEEGSAFFSGLSADSEFSGTVRVVPSCRDEAVEIAITDGEPEGSIPYTRQERAENCSFEVYIDGEHVQSFRISGTERVGLYIDRDGELDFAEEIL
ncbi:hypothetical protein GRS48_06820 [Halorubrum sp. JWXQ-INN 858]|uniref:hypothetical protein n=1 Tax=Halorubrum sp. JWXQ-INN 858 TaxID=2690782 RepID=UPI00135C2844|nr:hypothetical protein [Halorubrum sp. JWXQ-INN 858]MWV64537.1 hypothetical protein [Halorubrum sp. JWXQ-INN 858]